MAGDANIERFILLEDNPDSEESCFKKYGNLPDQGSPVCPPVWDSFFCWPPTEAGNIISYPCLKIFPFLQEITHGNHVAVAYRKCDENGFWSEGEWTNYTQCETLEAKPHLTDDPPIINPITISYVIFVCSIISLITLFISLFIFFYFKTLQCSRIRVHRNLVLSLILHAIMMLAVSLPGLFDSVDTFFKETDWLCKAVLVLKNYAAMTCIHWMFVEGLLLHSSITVSVFQREPPFKLYYCLGWVIPLACVGTWLLVMCLRFVSNSPCWKGYGQSPYVWLITGPMILALLVNAIFLVNIIRILVTKLRTSVSIEAKQVRKAMKATALLFPLLGITHLLFCINPRDDREHIYMLVNALMQSSQGLFVAVLYCFLNSEVQSVLSSAYTRYALRRDPRRSIRSSRGSRMFASTTSTSLSPEVLPNGSSGFQPKVRFALLHKKSSATVCTPLKALPEESPKKETAFVD